MELFQRLAARVEQHARDIAGSVLRIAERVIADFPDVTVHREGDELVISGRGLMQRWLSDARLRFALWNSR